MRSRGSVGNELMIGEKKTIEPGDEAMGLEVGFPTFRCIRRVTAFDVEAIEDE